jgi:dephospho-CoA kinase
VGEGYECSTRPQRVKFVGLSGGIGSGKSTLRQLLSSRGVITIDVDAVSRELQEPGQPFFEEIVARWGNRVVRADGQLDRAALGKIVFADRDQLAELTGMAAPATERELVRRASVPIAEEGAIVVVESALYTQPMYGMSGLVVVDVPADVAVARLVETRALSEADATARVASQASRELRLRQASYVVSNNGTRGELEDEVDPLLAWIRSEPDATPTLDWRGEPK